MGKHDETHVLWLTPVLQVFNVLYKFRRVKVLVLSENCVKHQKGTSQGRHIWVQLPFVSLGIKLVWDTLQGKWRITRITHSVDMTDSQDIAQTLVQPRIALVRRISAQTLWLRLRHQPSCHPCLLRVGCSNRFPPLKDQCPQNVVALKWYEQIGLLGCCHYSWLV